MDTQPSVKKRKVTFGMLFNFFIPLGISASLVTISHVIINGTLARAPNPAIVIASYSVAMSLFGVFERCAIIIRQTCATLVRDRHSFNLVKQLTIYVLTSIMLISLLIAYSPIGEWFFGSLLGVKENMIGPTVSAYRVLMFVTIFSGIRCLYHGVIISNLRTKWLTLGMIIRLVVMALLAWTLLKFDLVHHGYVGAYIFLAGMVIEAIVSMIEGRSLVKKMPEKKQDHQVVHRSHVLKFYMPLLLASLIAVIISPTINGVLGSSGRAEIAIASYAVAFSLLNLLLSFSSYVHQIVINFFEKDPKKVLRFTLIVSLIPITLLLAIAYSPIGVWLFQHVMGVSGELLIQCLVALKFFMIFAIFFPWLDFLNGVLMLKGQTKVMSFSQAGNVIVTVAGLFFLVFFLPNGGGMIGSLALSLGLMTETMIAFIFLIKYLRREGFSFKLKKVFQRG